ncbi:hypothetical protein AQUCO_02800204v1 [Aquilegia coerulea]|uniref:Uncharacterized protein n=1 Tax=Aquilegia coerulea TaxID=218851 RepID=A0A2G5D4C0_AQUCA|nr:hypothetical protein AQUCO_02800204v1 [Aquilegia coerulea]
MFKNLQHIRLFGVASSMFIVIAMTWCVILQLAALRTLCSTSDTLETCFCLVIGPIVILSKTSSHFAPLSTAILSAGVSEISFSSLHQLMEIQ